MGRETRGGLRKLLEDRESRRGAGNSVEIGQIDFRQVELLPIRQGDIKRLTRRSQFTLYRPIQMTLPGHAMHDLAGHQVQHGYDAQRHVLPKREKIACEAEFCVVSRLWAKA